MKMQTSISLLISLFIAACGSGTDTQTNLPSTAFAISSATYANNGVIPKTAVCTAEGGSNQSPQISLSNLPSSTNKIALVMDDEVSPCGSGVDACVHWAVFNLPASKTQFSVAEDLSSIPNVIFGTAYDGTTNGYAGPCPPSNHVYKLTAYALASSMPNISSSPTNSTRAAFEQQYANHILGKATLIGRYPQ